jgi:multidrug transporter EmrE-like cation transporter
MAWMYILIAGAFEIGRVYSLKSMEGFTNADMMNPFKKLCIFC